MEKHNKLTVLRKWMDGKVMRAEVKCDCGNIKTIIYWDLKRKNRPIQSCGCVRKEVGEKRHLQGVVAGNKNGRYSHGGKGTRLYAIWKGMKGRCYLKTNSVYYNYGARGVTVCKEWKESFVPFRDWALLNGYSEHLTLDRIDSSGNYSPENCRWATSKIQNRNTRANRIFEINGETMTMAEVCEKYNISQSKLSSRVNKLKWPIEKAITNVGTTRGNNKYKNDG